MRNFMISSIKVHIKSEKRKNEAIALLIKDLKGFGKQRKANRVRSLCQTVTAFRLLFVTPARGMIDRWKIKEIRSEIGC